MLLFVSPRRKARKSTFIRILKLFFLKRCSGNALMSRIIHEHETISIWLKWIALSCLRPPPLLFNCCYPLGTFCRPEKVAKYFCITCTLENIFCDVHILTPRSRFNFTIETLIVQFSHKSKLILIGLPKSSKWDMVLGLARICMYFFLRGWQLPPQYLASQKLPWCTSPEDFFQI